MTSPSSRRWIRPAVGLVLTLVWIAVAGLGGPYFGRIDEVATNDQSSYLPSSAESTQVQKRLTDFYGGDSIPAVVVAERAGGLTAEDLTWLQARSASLPEQVPAIPGGVSPAIPSADGEAAQIFVPLSTTSDVRAGVADLRAGLEGPPEGLAVYVTGAAGLSADLGEGFAGIDGLLLLVAVAAVLIILVVVYRSPLLPLMVLLASMSALCAAVVTNFYLAKVGVFKINAQVQGILFILVIGAATDYSLLYASRFREALRDNRSPWEATKVAWRGSVEPIVASGGTVIAGLLCLLLSDLASNKALGPGRRGRHRLRRAGRADVRSGDAAPGRTGRVLAPARRLRRRAPRAEPEEQLGQDRRDDAHAGPADVDRRRHPSGGRLCGRRRAEGRRCRRPATSCSVSRRRATGRMSLPPTSPAVPASRCR